MTVPKVLIVEDDASIGLVVSAALTAENIETQICDSVSARDAALANGHFDLMLTDVVLKDSDGLADAERGYGDDTGYAGDHYVRPEYLGDSGTGE
jgi:DNA-binding NtrC family response regulator